jgi:Rrf2 family iron-sulfur cluster assembly transcriptional regulator
MLSRSGIYAIRALLELALDPVRWRSVNDLAAAQSLPAPMLEQLLLKLRRADLVEARRGRQGGYRLARPAGAIPLVALLRAVQALPMGSTSDGADPTGEDQDQEPGDLVTLALQRRLRLALERELARLTLEELLFDLRSTHAAQSEEGGLLLG